MPLKSRDSKRRQLYRKQTIWKSKNKLFVRQKKSCPTGKILPGRKKILNYPIESGSRSQGRKN
jgi:hypothetical protein